MSRLSSVVIHCHDPYLAGPFWALAVGLEPVPEDAAAPSAPLLEDGESVLSRNPTGDGPDVWVNPHPVTGTGATAIPLHVDVQLDDLSELDRLVEAGATIRWEVPGDQPWTVLSSPDGVLFCAKHPAP